MVEVSIHPLAAAEYENALLWYAARSVQVALGFEKAIEQSIRYISLHPEAPPLCDQRHRYCKIRKYPYGIIYKLTDRGTRIVAVAHHRQLPGFWLERV